VVSQVRSSGPGAPGVRDLCEVINSAKMNEGLLLLERPLLFFV